MVFIADTQAQRFFAGGKGYRMAMGKHGAVLAGHKREGDGKTPLGRYGFEHGYCRADRHKMPETGVALHPIEDTDGWCDAPDHPRYNQHITAPFDASHEALLRDDCLYDLFFVLTHNRAPTVPYYGSAIFLHVAKDDGAELKPTQGCLALRWADLLEVSRHITRQSWLIIR